MATQLLQMMSSLSDEDVVRRVLDGEAELYEIIMRRHNQRLYRAVRSILRDPDEAEDVMQEAYVRAYLHLDQFAGEAAFSTWLTRIAVHEALARLRQRSRFVDVVDPRDPERQTMENLESPRPDPEKQAIRTETQTLLEAGIDSLPETYRTVFTLREIEGLSTAETAAVLDLNEQTVKIRLHRARRTLRNQLFASLRSATPQVFGFLGHRCDRVVRNVLQRII